MPILWTRANWEIGAQILDMLTDTDSHGVLLSCGRTQQFWREFNKTPWIVMAGLHSWLCNASLVSSICLHWYLSF